MSKIYLATGRKEQKLQTRKKILESAQKFISREEPYTLEDVAREVAISRATIYRYYSNVDLLSAEAVLDLQVLSSEAILKDVKSGNLKEQLLGIQKYYNNLVIDNESAFRKYLGIVLSGNPHDYNRGSRRVETLELALQDNRLALSEHEKQMLITVASVLMGLEAFVVTKDVCGLNSTQSKKALQWGLEMVLKGILNDKKI